MQYRSVLCLMGLDSLARLLMYSQVTLEPKTLELTGRKLWWHRPPTSLDIYRACMPNYLYLVFHMRRLQLRSHYDMRSLLNDNSSMDSIFYGRGDINPATLNKIDTPSLNLARMINAFFRRSIVSLIY